ncbi:MAG: sigma-70 family RNA polymerase sigma factor [Armatimonadetes bacterium]|nr:sigma-70 family RNA polymerase sigma factor [Armatimonadota bacterium]
MSENLVELAKAGSVEAFDRLVALHQGQVFALAYRILGNRDDAADAQQETFVRAWQHLRSFRQDAAFSTWLHRITVNLCMSAKRRRNCATYEYQPEHTAEHSTSSNPGQAAEALRRVLGAMPAHYRVLVVLRDVEGRSFEEIAHILRCSVGSARARLCRARSILRERMRPYIREEDA